MVQRGAFRRKLKEKKAVERQDKSLCVKIKNRIEKSSILSLVLPLHRGIDQIFFPRQKKPKFCFVLCKSPTLKAEVSMALRDFKNDEIGYLIPKDVFLRAPAKPKETIKRSINKKIIILEGLPRDLKTEAIQEIYLKATKINRFNPRRCYLHFENVRDSMEAFERLSSEPIQGSLLRPKFHMSKVNEKCESDDGDAVDGYEECDSE